MQRLPCCSSPRGLCTSRTPSRQQHWGTTRLGVNGTSKHAICERERQRERVCVLCFLPVLMRFLGCARAFVQFLVIARFARWAFFRYFLFEISCQCLGRVVRCPIFDNTSSSEQRCALTSNCFHANRDNPKNPTIESTLFFARFKAFFINYQVVLSVTCGRQCLMLSHDDDACVMSACSVSVYCVHVIAPGCFFCLGCHKCSHSDLIARRGA